MAIASTSPCCALPGSRAMARSWSRHTLRRAEVDPSPAAIDATENLAVVSGEPPEAVVAATEPGAEKAQE